MTVEILKTPVFLGARRNRRGFSFDYRMQKSLYERAQAVAASFPDDKDFYPVSWYKVTGFILANRYLRGLGVPDEDRGYYEDGAWEKTAENWVQRVDNVISDVETTVGFHGYETLYRYVPLTEQYGEETEEHPSYWHRPDTRALDDFVAQFEVGNVIEDKGYISTSVDSDYIVRREREAGFPGTNIVFEIHTRRGMVAYTSRGVGYSIQDWEREVLLPRGLKFRVHAIHRNVTFESAETSTGGHFPRPIEEEWEKRATVTVIQLIELPDYEGIVSEVAYVDRKRVNEAVWAEESKKVAAWVNSRD